MFKKIKKQNDFFKERKKIDRKSSRLFSGGVILRAVKYLVRHGKHLVIW